MYPFDKENLTKFSITSRWVLQSQIKWLNGSIFYKAKKRVVHKNKLKKTSFGNVDEKEFIQV